MEFNSIPNPIRHSIFVPEKEPYITILRKMLTREK